MNSMIISRHLTMVKIDKFVGNLCPVIAFQSVLDKRHHSTYPPPLYSVIQADPLNVAPKGWFLNLVGNVQLYYAFFLLLKIIIFCVFSVLQCDHMRKCVYIYKCITSGFLFVCVRTCVRACRYVLTIIVIYYFFHKCCI